MPKPTDSPLPSGTENDLLSPDLNYLVGVSGGRDSVVLLHWLIKEGIKNLVVCHFNHGLRGEASDADEAFVEELSENLGLECVSAGNDSQKYAEESRQSLETAARECRYRFFAGIAAEKHCPRLILAHHADDQVETVIMNFFRGTGLNGLGGMTPRSHRKIEGQALEIIRPFLAVTRERIDQYRTANQLEFREDETNSELFATRNRVRHELIPLAADIFQRDSTAAILRLSQIAETEAAAARLRAKAWLETHQNREDGSLPLGELRDLSPADLNHVIHAWLKSQDVGDCGFTEVQLVVEIIRGNGRPAKVNLPGGNYARRRSGIVFVTDQG